VSADDVDLATVSYEFQHNYNEFILDVYSGDVFLKNQLDREVTSLHTLTVLASDGSLTSTATVYVNVEDANEPVTFVQSTYT
jgi:F0F1-type ATP synthase beta subunit